MTTQQTTKTKKLGVIGLASVAAILSIALLTASFSGFQAQAEPANKVSWSNDDDAIAAIWDGTGNDPVVNEVPLQSFELKTSDKGDWLIDMAIECSTFTTVEAKGKKGDELSGAFAGAVVTLYVDEEPNKSWNVCQQDFQTKAYLNDVIVKDPETGVLAFNCDGDVKVEDGTPCEQFVQMYLLNAGSYNAKWVAANLSAGENHLIEIKAVLNAGSSTLGEAPEEPSGINAGVIIGRNVVIAEPIHVAVGDL